MPIQQIAAAGLVLLTAALRTHTVATQVASLPACPGLRLRATSAPRSAGPGSSVVVRIKVKNTGAAALRDLNVGVTFESLAAPQKKAGRWGKSARQRIEGQGVYWIDQVVRPGRSRRYRPKAQICSGAAIGDQLLAQVFGYRLNATGGVFCLSKAAPLRVGSVHVRERESA